MKKICFVLTAEFSVKAFLLNHLIALSKIYDVTVIVNTNNPNFLSQQGIKAQVIPLTISRDINLVSDFRCLIQLIKIFWKFKFLVIHSITPKAGLLAMLAAWVSLTPIRVHTYTGQVWADKVGFKRLALKMIDWFYGKLSTHNIIDSPSQRDFLINEGVLSPNKCLVFGKGSIAGVDISQFKPNPVIRKQVRDSYGLLDSSFMLLFLGRLNRDKGVLDLAKAFITMRKHNTNAHLIFVGPDEANMKQAIMDTNGFSDAFIKFDNYTNQPEKFMVAADLLCLPSYREGFGSVIIEAAACGTPALASRIYGITDAVVENETGLLHTPKNVNEITEKLMYLADNLPICKQLGEGAYHRAVNEFDSQLITQAWCDFYKKLRL